MLKKRNVNFLFLLVKNILIIEHLFHKYFVCLSVTVDFATMKINVKCVQRFQFLSIYDFFLPFGLSFFLRWVSKGRNLATIWYNRPCSIMQRENIGLGRFYHIICFHVVSVVLLLGWVRLIKGVSRMIRGSPQGLEHFEILGNTCCSITNRVQILFTQI